MNEREPGLRRSGLGSCSLYPRQRDYKSHGTKTHRTRNLSVFVNTRLPFASNSLTMPLKTSKGYGLVVIDGIRDLMYDINSRSDTFIFYVALRVGMGSMGMQGITELFHPWA